MILSAVISGICNMQNVTDVIIKHVGQSNKSFINEEGHLMNKVYIDTGKLNIFTCGDINPGIQKLLQVVYVTKVSNDEEKHHEEKHEDCNCLNVICHPKKVHEYYCDYIDDERYICFNEEVINCEQHVARCLEKDCHCDDNKKDCHCDDKEKDCEDDLNNCEEELENSEKKRKECEKKNKQYKKKIDECEKDLKKKEKKLKKANKKLQKCKHKLKNCSNDDGDCCVQHVNNCIKKNSMLIFPLYPIHKPFAYTCPQKKH